MTTRPFGVLLPGSPELPFITVIFMRPVLWRLAMFGSQETEHVKYAPSEIRNTSKRVTAGDVCCDYKDAVHTLRVLWLCICVGFFFQTCG